MNQVKPPSTNNKSWLQKARSSTQHPRWEVLVGIATTVFQHLAFGILVLVTITYLSHLGLGMARGLTFDEAIARSALRTLDSLGRIYRGDFGLSPAASGTFNPLPVVEVVPLMLSKSLGLLGVSLLVASLIGLVLGVWASGRRHSGWSLITLLISIAGVSVPSFVAAMLLQMAVIRLTRVVGRPFLPVGGFGWDTHIILPALVLAARPVAQIARITFVSINEVLAQDYVRTAHSKGLPPRMVMIRHVMRNVAVPIATTIGLSLRFSLSSLPVVELFFGWSGLGFYLLKAISRQDDNLTVILVLCLGILFILVNLVLDVIYRLFDPRLRESRAQVRRVERETWWHSVKFLLADLRDFVAYNPFKRWIASRKAAPSPNPFRIVLEERGERIGEGLEPSRIGTRRAWLRGALGNLPLVMGIVLVTGLLVIAFFGHSLAPHSPYTTRGLEIVDGKFTVPPFEPDETYPWGTDVLGRDIMSLVLTGAWQTIRLAATVVLARILVGFVLGATAGWLNGRWIDRILLRIAEVISAFPTLLLAMTLILALGIRKGFAPFVIALCFVGWGEVMQFVRGEVMTMRPKAFIEGAVAIGLRTPRIILNHVLPNLVPALISLTALEMGAVLMLLGELGFIGIFIGGGAFAELDVAAAPYHYSDVPEWGALLSNVRTYIYSYPWTAIYPAIAFFVAILGFNLFGEGVRRLVDDVGIRVTKLVNRYTVLLALLGVMVISQVQGGTGALAVYSSQAETFDGQQALANVEVLTDPSMEGRALGTQGMDNAAEWIAQKFESLGLQAAGEDLTYFQTRPRGYESLDGVPSLVIQDGGPSLVYHEDYVEFSGRYRNLGQASGRVRFLGMGELTRISYSRDYPALEKMDYTGEILVVLSDRQAAYIQRVPRAGVLVVTEDPDVLKRSYTLSSRDPTWRVYGTDRISGQDIPVLWISESTANRLLKGTDQTVADLRLMTEGLVRDELVEIPVGAVASMEVQGTVYEKVTVRHVIGHMPGTYGLPGLQLDDHLIVVLAQYDTPPPNPDGGPYLGANDNASGLAVMLEAIRVMQESGYQPYKTFLFVAYSGEGLEGGSPASRPEVAKLLQAKHGFSFAFEIEAVIDLRGLGAGEGEGLILSTGGSLRLVNLFKKVARRMGVRASRAGEVLDLSIVFETGSSFDSGEEAPRISIAWDGWEASSHVRTDNLEAISVDKLEKSGRALSLALMIMGREIQY